MVVQLLSHIHLLGLYRFLGTIEGGLALEPLALYTCHVKIMRRALKSKGTLPSSISRSESRISWLSYFSSNAKAALRGSNRASVAVSIIIIVGDGREGRREEESKFQRIKSRISSDQGHLIGSLAETLSGSATALH